MKPSVKVIFDRRKDVEETGFGAVEILICFTRSSKTYVRIDLISPEEWEKCDPNVKYAEKIANIEGILAKMEKRNMANTVENFNSLIQRKTYHFQRKVKYTLFTDFMRDEVVSEEQKESTCHRKLLTVEKLIEFGKFKKFCTVTPENIMAFDQWLHDGTRKQISIYTYHKHFKKYCRIAYEKGYLKENPYSKVHFARGTCEERNPLTPEELERVRDIHLTGHLDRARDLFIFAANTGLAYCDIIGFQFNDMTERIDNLYYIDGKRIKTETNFFTPILPDGMDVLMKYNYELPKMSNQKVNDYLRIVASMANIHKKMTFHIARHTFATQALAHDIPIDKVARMLGHKEIKTTQIYAKVLKESVAKHADKWINDLASKGARSSEYVDVPCIQNCHPQQEETIIQKRNVSMHAESANVQVSPVSSKPTPEPTPAPSYQQEYLAYPEYSGYSISSYSYSYV